MDRGRDIVLPGAFKNTLAVNGLPKLLWQHNTDEPIGIITEAREDEKGLFVAGKMPKNDSLVSGRVIPQMQIRSVDSMSIGFRTKRFEDDIDNDVRRHERSRQDQH